MKVVNLIIFVFVIVSCKRDYGDPRKPPLPVADEEVITSFQIMIKDSATGSTHTYSFRDDDGALNNGGAYYGPDKLTQTDSVIKLKPNSVYFCEIILLNESVMPADTVSKEVEEHADEHQFFYAPKKNKVVISDPYTVAIDGSGLKIVYLDKDSHNLPLGLKTKWKTGAAELVRGFDVVLKHHHEEKNGRYDGGETDIKVDFSIEVE